ncbi:uncharacterized protein LOC121838075 isoform X3 [Ixodes scapularis]|uniref:uncharacterized protein LOC121838075 isoform X3 n=1 Tax=Ixodes scapularis TaxID=6945 RepID=UPI001C395291|nr:uncharacterized protein LOC121838075 isoform X3 [Ixodes scapularis]
MIIVIFAKPSLVDGGGAACGAMSPAALRWPMLFLAVSAEVLGVQGRSSVGSGLSRDEAGGEYAPSGQDPRPLGPGDGRGGLSAKASPGARGPRPCEFGGAVRFLQPDRVELLAAASPGHLEGPAQGEPPGRRDPGTHAGRRLEAQAQDPGTEPLRRRGHHRRMAAVSGTSLPTN